MSEELTLEELDEWIADYKARIKQMGGRQPIHDKLTKTLAVCEAARAHLSRPVVGDEQMREALELADLWEPELSLLPDDDIWQMLTVKEYRNIFRALLAMYDKMAEYKAKADAYDAGLVVYHDKLTHTKNEEGAFVAFERKWRDHEIEYRVCKPVGDG